MRKRTVRFHVQIKTVKGEWQTVSRHNSASAGKTYIHTKVLVKGKKYHVRLKDVIDNKIIVEFD